MLTVKQVRPILESYVDSIGRNRAGNIVLRKGFFYTHGRDGHTFAQAVIARLAAEGIVAQAVAVDTVWKPFRGGATVSQSSHFLAVLA